MNENVMRCWPKEWLEAAVKAGFAVESKDGEYTFSGVREREMLEVFAGELFANPVIEQERKDAERYRWLRKQHWSDSHLAVVYAPKDSVKLGRNCPSLELLDESIDDAMKGDA